MRRKHMTIDMLCGIALIAVCVVCVLASVKLCDGDITPAFIIVPMGLCAMIGDDHKSYKTESKRRK